MQRRKGKKTSQASERDGNGKELTLSQASRRACRHQSKIQRAFPGKVGPQFSSFKKHENERQERATHFLTGLTNVSQSLTHGFLKLFTGTPHLGITGGHWGLRVAMVWERSGWSQRQK